MHLGNVWKGETTERSNHLNPAKEKLAKEVGDRWGPSSKDATVISMGINKPLVKRVLIDMWSSVNVMYHDVFVKLGSTPNNPNFARGFYRGHLETEGSIRLPVELVERGKVNCSEEEMGRPPIWYPTTTCLAPVAFYLKTLASLVFHPPPPCMLALLRFQTLVVLHLHVAGDTRKPQELYASHLSQETHFLAIWDLLAPSILTFRTASMPAI
nr:uncharacterized protein LOC109183154 [Ipomoea trifida]